MGVPARIVVYASSDELAREATERAYARIAAFDDACSDYRVDSEIAQIAARADGSPQRVSDPLASILASAQRVHAASAGAFDPAIGASTHLWRAARDGGKFPSHDHWKSMHARGGWQRLAFDPVRKTVAPPAGLELDLGGIAKGAAAQAAIEELAAAGCEHALVALAGDVACGAAPPGERGWRVDVDLGFIGARAHVLELEHASVSTSGDSEQAIEHEGLRHSHVIDPRSGRPLTRRTACCVVVPHAAAPDAGALADALSTAVSVLGLDAGGAMLVRLGVQAYGAELREGKLVERELQR